jgi:preprotein translocase subunit SecB
MGNCIGAARTDDRRTRVLIMVRKTTNQNEAKNAKLLLALPVSNQVEIHGVNLVETRARKALVDDRLPEQLELQIGVKARTEATKAKGCGIAVVVEFDVAGRYTGVDSKVAPLQIAATFQVEYTLDSLEGIKSENIKAFAELNGVYSAWPYWREYAQSVTVRMGLPPMPVPVYRTGEGKYLSGKAKGKPTKKTAQPKKTKKRGRPKARAE